VGKLGRRADCREGRRDDREDSFCQTGDSPATPLFAVQHGQNKAQRMNELQYLIIWLALIAIGLPIVVGNFMIGIATVRAHRRVKELMEKHAEWQLEQFNAVRKGL
jgi:hypothetical protein